MKRIGNINAIYDLSCAMVDELTDIISALPDMFLDTQDPLGVNDRIYGLKWSYEPMDNSTSIYEERIIGLTIFDGTLCAFMEDPESDNVYSKEQMLEGDKWISIDTTSSIFYVQTVLNIMDSIEEYLH